MDTSSELIKIFQLSDSAFPSGAFAFSGGLESLTRERETFSIEDLVFVLKEQIIPRWFDFDRVFLRDAHNCMGDIGKLVDVDKSCHLQNTNASLQFLTATDTNRKKFLIDLLRLDEYVQLFEIFKEAF